jgi:thioredoxin 1
MISLIIEWILNHPGLAIFVALMAYRLYQTLFYREPVVEGSRVVQVNSMDQFQEMLKNNKILLANFSANWCPGCRTAAPEFAKLSKEMKKVAFVKINVDVGRDIAQEFQIESIPAFKLFHDGNVAKSFVGFDGEAISKAIVSLVSDSKKEK